MWARRLRRWTQLLAETIGDVGDPLGKAAGDRDMFGQGLWPERRDAFDALGPHDPTPLATNEAQDSSYLHICEVVAERCTHDVDLAENSVDERPPLATPTSSCRRRRKRLRRSW